MKTTSMVVVVVVGCRFYGNESKRAGEEKEKARSHY
jgi:hypothetical protein